MSSLNMGKDILADALPILSDAADNPEFFAPRDNRYSSGERSSLSPKYLNDGYLWSDALDGRITGDHVTELCSGSSLVIDLALAIRRYRGEFHKVDFKEWNDGNAKTLNRPYQTKYTIDDAISYVAQLPHGSVTLNHVLDDLFIGQWAVENRVDLFTYKHPQADVLAFWSDAMANREKYIPRIVEMFRTIGSHLARDAHIILREYASTRDIKFLDIPRLELVQGMLDSVVEALERDGLGSSDIAIRAERHPSFHHPEDTFFGFSKR